MNDAALFLLCIDRCFYIYGIVSTIVIDFYRTAQNNDKKNNVHCQNGKYVHRNKRSD